MAAMRRRKTNSKLPQSALSVIDQWPLHGRQFDN